MSLTTLYEDPLNLFKMPTSDLFDLDYSEVAELQLRHFRNRFHELRGKIPALRALAEDVGMDDIAGFDDLATIAFPHTIYKSYDAADLENGRFDRMTKWFQCLTAHDLSQVDVSDCHDIDTWLDRLAEATPLRPGVSSGTSGKISVFPRSVPEMPLFLACVVSMLDPYRGEHAVDFRAGNVPIFTAYPASSGTPGILQIFKMMREQFYGGRTDMTVTLRDRFISVQELTFSAKWRKAERLGQALELTPTEERLKAEMLLPPEEIESLWDRFLDRLVVQQKGKTILFMGAWVQVYQIALACKKRGIKIEWAPDSVVASGGGTKGFVFPDGWRELIAEVFGPYYPQCFRENYGMSETTASMICCEAEGHLHPLPWGIQHVADPDTGRPLPRKGVQTGRLLVFDLLPGTYWSGTASGDGVTANWDGGCSCGRKGPYFHNGIGRLSDMRGGLQDKIVCFDNPDAYDSLERRLANLEVSSGMTEV
jgi:hypothetical protein